jgi:hypothetical protein
MIMGGNTQWGANTQRAGDGSPYRGRDGSPYRGRQWQPVQRAAMAARTENTCVGGGTAAPLSQQGNEHER